MAEPAHDDAAQPPGPGDQQPGEPARAFAAFRIYVDLGDGRTTAAVGQRLGHRSERQSQTWSARWDWQRRIRELRRDEVRAADAGRAELLRERSELQAQEARDIAAVAAAVAREALRRIEENPEALRALKLADVVGLVGSVSRAHANAVRTERLALGLTTEQPGEATPRGAAEALVSRLTDEELDAKLAGTDELAAKRAEREQASA